MEYAYCFREARSMDELESLIKLRYRIYRKSRYQTFCPENEWGINLDVYDGRARHYGLFRLEPGYERPVGYMRVIENRKTAAKCWVEKIAWKCDQVLLAQVSVVPELPFLLMEYIPGVKNLVEKQMQAHPDEPFCEASRFIIDPEQASLRLGKFMIEAVIAASVFYHGLRHALIACSELHSDFYRQYGFSPARETGYIEIPSNNPKGRKSIAIIQSDYRKMAPADVRQRLSAMATDYAACGRIVFHAARHSGFQTALQATQRAAFIPPAVPAFAMLYARQYALLP